MNRIPCKKCLLSEIDPGEELKKIQELIALMPDREKVAAEEYHRRLDICKDCEALSQGTCLQCGCYVELRAIKRDAACPQKNKWKR